MGITLKGAQQIKTLARLKMSGSSAGDRHVRHFQVASLEIERTRRLKERQEAVRRIESTDQRLREIEEILASHYAVLGLSDGDGPDRIGTSHAAVGGGSTYRASYEDETREEPRSPGPRQMLVYGR